MVSPWNDADCRPLTPLSQPRPRRRSRRAGWDGSPSSASVSAAWISGSAKGLTRYATGSSRWSRCSGGRCSRRSAERRLGCAKGLRALDGGRVRRLEDDRFDDAERGVVEHGLVAHSGNDAAQKLPHFGMGLANEHSCHVLTIVRGRSNVGCIWYGTGMKRSRILVVDDDSDIRGLLRELLSRAGTTSPRPRAARPACASSTRRRPISSFWTSRCRSWTGGRRWSGSAT